jgi:thiamine-monophosphate kinase
VGGDTNASPRLVLSVALLGRVPRGRAVTRSGARVGDVLFVTGRLGGSFRSGRHLRFEPRLKEAEFLMRKYRPHAMMDLSDGLASDLRRIAEASGVGAIVCAEAVPRSEGAGLSAALQDGEDFELLFALPPRDAARLSLESPRGLAPFSPIGKVVHRRMGITLFQRGEALRPLPAGGFDHFRSP